MTLRYGRIARALGGTVAALVCGLGTGPAAADAPCPVNAFDCAAIGRFSATADATSDLFFVTSLALPVVLELGRGLDDDSDRRGLAYGGAVAATAVTALITKLVVRRARPYTYSAAPGVRAFARTARGNHHSFFSGHTSLAFAAATAGGILHNAVSDDDGGRYAAWVAGGALAAATGVLRVRAGKHFPSDVVVGAVIGTAAGVGITLAIAPDASLRWQDGAAFGGGLALGAVAAALIPMPRDVVLPLGARGDVVIEGPIGVVPMAVPGGLGLALAAQLR